MEASAFRGEEPDENRYNIEAPKLDSYSQRLSWSSGPWEAQVSAGHLHQPEWFEPYDDTRITASVGDQGALGSRPLAATLVWARTATPSSPTACRTVSSSNGTCTSPVA